MYLNIPTTAAQPDWMILGVRREPGDGVCVYASKTLRSVRMTFEFADDHRFFKDLALSEGSSRINMTAVLDDYVFVIAASYSEAITKLGDLFKAWERQERWNPTLEAVPPAADNVRELRRPIELGTGE